MNVNFHPSRTNHIRPDIDRVARCGITALSQKCSNFVAIDISTMYSLPILEDEISKRRPAYSNTVSIGIAELVERGIATTLEIDAWVRHNENCSWLEGASMSVIRNLYRGRLRKLVKREGRYFTRLFVDRSLWSFKR